MADESHGDNPSDDLDDAVSGNEEMREEFKSKSENSWEAVTRLIFVECEEGEHPVEEGTGEEDSAIESFTGHDINIPEQGSLVDLVEYIEYEDSSEETTESKSNQQLYEVTEVNTLYVRDSLETIEGEKLSDETPFLWAYIGVKQLSNGTEDEDLPESSQGESDTDE